MTDFHSYFFGDNLFATNIFYIVFSIVISFAITYIIIPRIITVSKEKKLFDEINDRKIHTSKIPTLGGVAIFAGLIITSLITMNGFDFNTIKYLIASIVLIFFIGLKDDISAITPWKKLAVQITATLIIILLGNYRFTNLHGILGIHEINYFWSVAISLFAIISITNAFNLIDGVDGLASGIAFISSVVLGSWFCLSGHPEYSILAFSLAGSLMAFFGFNVFGKKNKLFMGDTGSLIIGFVISALIIRFNEFNLVPNKFNVNSAPVISFAIIVIPVVDTIRVFVLRILKKKSPFSADRSHIHHQLFSLFNGNHLKVTATMFVFNILFIAVGYFVTQSPININYQLLIMAVFGFGMAMVPGRLVSRKHRKEQESIVVNINFKEAELINGERKKELVPVNHFD